LTVDELKKLASLISAIQVKREETYGQYDVKQSISAATWFDSKGQSIEAISSVDFISQINTIIELRKTEMSNNSAGELNGGKGTLNSCYCRLAAIVEQEKTYKEANAELIKELRSISKADFSLPSAFQVLNILEAIDERIPLHYLCVGIIVSLLLAVTFLW